MVDAPTIDNRVGLRACLIGMRAELVERMARAGIEGGTLTLLAGVSAAIEATEAVAEAPAAAFEGDRAVLADDGATRIVSRGHECREQPRCGPGAQAARLSGPECYVPRGSRPPTLRCGLSACALQAASGRRRQTTLQLCARRSKLGRVLVPSRGRNQRSWDAGKYRITIDFTNVFHPGSAKKTVAA